MMLHHAKNETSYITFFKNHTSTSNSYIIFWCIKHQHHTSFLIHQNHTSYINIIFWCLNDGTSYIKKMMYQWCLTEHHSYIIMKMMYHQKMVYDVTLFKSYFVTFSLFVSLSQKSGWPVFEVFRFRVSQSRSFMWKTSGT